MRQTLSLLAIVTSALLAGCGGGGGSHASSTTAAPGSLAFNSEPVGAAAGTPFSTQPVVQVLDSLGALNTSSTATVTLTLGAGSPAGTLSGTAAVAAVAGVATFTGLSLDKAGDYTLLATASGLTSASSTAFTITPGAAARLAFAAAPAAARGGEPLGTQPSVELEDALGNVVTTDSSTVITASVAPSAPFAVTVDARTASPMSTCTCCPNGCGFWIDGEDAKQIFLGRGLAYSFEVPSIPGHSFFITTSPNGGGGGTPYSTGVTGNNTSGPSTVTFTPDASAPTLLYYQCSLHVHMGSSIHISGAATALSGSSTATASSGVARFAGLAVNPLGSYTLTFSGGGFTLAAPSIDVTEGVPAALSVTAQPGGATHGLGFGTQPVVEVRDAGGNVLLSQSSFTVTASIKASTGTAGAALGGTKTVTASEGVATFTDLTIDMAGTGYVLTFSNSGGTITVDSDPFDVN